ncbi:Palmitoyl-protein thioesterase 1 [Camponotus floridanus]|uniref:Palmitoyl-protein thioesterase 1 n=1 Tax=Camponotus floridanus TaxID=104421 RepID=E2AKU6_CAMFO|nr:Palmitoyl-protein thioesterase 1 [Camponotus floridanus]
MLNLISLGGQHQGVFGIPKCTDTSRLCNYMRRILRYAAYFEYIQESLVQAAYWHDPLQEDEYRNKNVFLADINNEKIINPVRENDYALKFLILLQLNFNQYDCKKMTYLIKIP